LGIVEEDAAAEVEEENTDFPAFDEV